MDPSASTSDRTVQRRLPRRGALTSAIVRRLAPIALALTLAGCGSSQSTRENVPRPAPPVTMTAAVQNDVVRVSPSAVGAGQVVLVVSNQSARPQTVTFETDELGGKSPGNRASSPTIAPQGTGRLTINVRQGTYSIHVGDRTIRAARVEVGPPRESGQNQLLLP
jgi:hypothetical protein